MTTQTPLSPVLPCLLASLLDPAQDTVHLVSPCFSGVDTVLASFGFKSLVQAISETSATSATSEMPAGQGAATDGTTLAAILPGNHRDFPDIERTVLMDFLAGPASRAVLILSPYVLSVPREGELRCELLRRNCVEASFQLPAGLLPGCPHPAALLILDKRRRVAGDSNNEPLSCEQVAQAFKIHFRDVSRLDIRCIERLWQEGNVAGIRELVARAFDCGQADCATADSRDLLLPGGLSLLARAYCLDDRARQAQAYVRSHHVVSLCALARSFGSPWFADEDQGECVHVLVTDDLQSCGYTVPEGTRCRKLNLEHCRSSLIQPGDIVINIRGKLGRIGMLAPDWKADGSWVADRDCVVLRSSGKDYDMRLLFLYLRSEIGQTVLQTLARRTLIPGISARELMALHIPQPSEEEARELIADFEKELPLCERMRALQNEARALGRRHYVLPE